MSSTVRVGGVAVVRGEPDEVEFRFSVTYIGPTPEEALAEVIERNAELESVLESLRIGRNRRSTTGATVKPETEWIKDRYVHHGYRATVSTIVRLEDASVAGRLIKDATAIAQVGVDGPWWRVALDNPARTEACRQAAAEARRKADAFAESLGTRLGAVLEVVEPGLGDIDHYRGGYGGLVMSADMDSASELNIEAGELDIKAEVIVTFALENAV